ncbi:MAG: hypothetical protein VR65_07515 [Desulfobulbaceae bacterium BRH_c16a]|nr:MAG: hypothetical protein VR65_07515 [Desulfobulbaceae bacterium BRH_c16a]
MTDIRHNKESFNEEYLNDNKIFPHIHMKKRGRLSLVCPSTVDEKVVCPRFRRFRCWLSASGIFIGFWLLVYYFTWIYNPLPSDESMIKNFKEHRADFVEAVRRYREYPRPNDKDTSLWFEEGDTLEVYRRAGISRITNNAGVWLHDPYSQETDKKINYEITVKHNHALLHQFGTLKIVPSTPQTKQGARWDWTDNRAFRKGKIIYGVIWKDYNFFPEPPRIEDGMLLWPSKKKSWVLASLNQIPKDWKDFECVYRQIEPQWYLRLCNGH